MRFMRVALLSVLLVFLFSIPVFASENEGDEIYEEQQSEAIDKVDDAYDSVASKADPNNIYDSIVGQVNKNKGVNPFKAFLRGFYGVYGYIRSLGPVIAVGGVVIGVLIALFSRKNKTWRKFGITLAIVVPLLVILIVFGIGYLNSMLLY